MCEGVGCEGEEVRVEGECVKVWGVRMEGECVRVWGCEGRLSQGYGGGRLS